MYSRRFRYRLFAWGRLLLALGVLVLFLCVYLSRLQRWSDLRSILMDLQFTGALMGGGLVVLAILAVTALAGRWYCSVLCPFGSLQEVFFRTGRLLPVRKARFVSPWRLRYLVPVLTGIGIVALYPLFLPMDPISNFGRGVRGVQTLVAEGFAAMPPGLWVILGMFAFVLALAAARGRRFCDWCPVGTLLGLFASVAPLGMRLRKDACISCGSCERSCPVNCIDSKNKTLDGSRCILCLSCAGNCAVGALGYRFASSAMETGRRAFLRRGGGILASLAGMVYLGGAAAHRAFPEGLAGRHSAGSLPFVLPPGARNVNRFFANCIGCQACVAACPAEIVRVDDGLHPRLDYTRGYCQYNCTECTHVCPTHALHPLRGEKQRTRIGLSDLDSSKCVAVTRGEACGACAEVCPTHALRMELPPSGVPPTVLVFDPDYCIGCGGCFHVCPAEPRAFVVMGVSPQTLTPGIRPAEPDKNDAAPGIPASGDEFPF